MAPIFNEFEDERALAEEVQSRISQGTSRTTIMSYRTRMIGPNASRTKPRPVRLMNSKGPSRRGITKKAMSSVLFCTTSVFQNKKVAISKKNSTVAESCW